MTVFAAADIDDNDDAGEGNVFVSILEGLRRNVLHLIIICHGGARIFANSAADFSSTEDCIDSLHDPDYHCLSRSKLVIQSPPSLSAVSALCVHDDWPAIYSSTLGGS